MSIDNEFFQEKDIKSSESKNLSLWTREEEQFLQESWGYISVETIAKKMNRSIEAVKSKASRMKLGNSIENNLNYLTIKEIERCLNVSEGRIRKTWKKHGLKIQYIKITAKKRTTVVKIDDLIQFLKEHQDFFDSRFLERNIFGEEPKWLLEKRKKDLLNPPKEYKEWTKQDISYAIQMLNLGKNYEEIGEKLGRTKEAVRDKLYELNYSYKLAKFWTSEEIKVIRENYEQGFPLKYNELADKIGRSLLAVKSKCEELEYNKKRSLQLQKELQKEAIDE